jgi:hypothetical protein
MGRSLAIVFALATLKNCGCTLLRKQWKPIIISQVRWREGHPALRLGADLGKCRDYPYLRNPGTCSFCNHSNAATSNRRDEVSIGVVSSFFDDSLLCPVSFSAGRETLLGLAVRADGLGKDASHRQGYWLFHQLGHSWVPAHRPAVGRKYDGCLLGSQSNDGNHQPTG